MSAMIAEARPKTLNGSASRDTLSSPFGPNGIGRENRMDAFLYKLEQEDGTPADPPGASSSPLGALLWRPGGDHRAPFKKSPWV